MFCVVTCFFNWWPPKWCFLKLIKPKWIFCRKTSKMNWVPVYFNLSKSTYYKNDTALRYKKVIWNLNIKFNRHGLKLAISASNSEELAPLDVRTISLEWHWITLIPRRASHFSVISVAANACINNGKAPTHQHFAFTSELEPFFIPSWERRKNTKRGKNPLWINISRCCLIITH